MNEIEKYIRERAVFYGIDPNIAVRVAQSEGGLQDPTQQSNFSKGGRREPSFGPFQLLVGGEGTGFPTGLGNEFIDKYGVHPNDDWRLGVDFALATAAEDGWRKWYGAGKAGIGRWDGIRNAPGTTLNSNPIAAGSPAPPITTSRDVASYPVMPITPTPTTSAVASAPVTSETDGLKSALKSLADNADNTSPGQFLQQLAKILSPVENSSNDAEASNITPASALTASMNADQGRMQAAFQLISQLMAKQRERREVPGMSLNSGPMQGAFQLVSQLMANQR